MQPSLSADGKQWYELTSKDFSKELEKHRIICAENERMHTKKGPENMTKITRDRIKDAKFDYSTLSGCVSDIRKTFWNLDRINEFFKNKIKTTHSHFYNQLMSG